MILKSRAIGSDLTIGSKQATVDTKKLNTVCNSTERKKEKKKMKISNYKQCKDTKVKHSSNSQEKVVHHKINLRRSQDDAISNIKQTKNLIKDNIKFQTRNFAETEGQTIQDLSTISPLNHKKNIINDEDISIKFTDENVVEDNAKEVQKCHNNVLSKHNNTKSQKLNINDSHKNIDHHNKACEEDEVDLLTFNEYIANARMAKEQKHAISHQSHLNFIRPLSNKETPMAKNRLEMQAEFNIQNLLKCKLKRKKVQHENLEEKSNTKKVKNFNFKTPPPELAQIMMFSRKP